MFFVLGLENPAGLRFVFNRGMGNLIRIRSRFIRGMENPADFWFVFIRGIKNQIGIRFIRPLAWPFVGRIQYAPTLTDEILSIFLPIRPLAWPLVGRIQYAPTLTDEILSIFLPIRPLAWSLVGRIQYAPTLTDENSSGFGFVFSRCRRKSPFFRVPV